MNIQFVCLIKERIEDGYSILLNKENVLLLPQHIPDGVTTRKIACNFELPLDTTIYVDSADFDEDTKRVTVLSYLELTRPKIKENNNLEPIMTEELSEIIKQMILDKSTYPSDMFK